MPGKRCLNQRKAGARTIDQAHHRGGDAFEIIVGKACQKVVRQRGHRVDQRLAGMAVGRKTQLAHQRGKLAAQPGNAVRRSGERRAGPHACMHGQRRNLAAFETRYDEQVEWHPPVHVGDAIGFDDQRHAALPVVASFLEPAESAVERGGGEQRFGAGAANAERIFLSAVAMARDRTELGQHPVG